MGVLLGTKDGVRVIGLKVGKRVGLIEGANVGVSEGESEGCCVGYEMAEYLENNWVYMMDCSSVLMMEAL